MKLHLVAGLTTILTAACGTGDGDGASPLACEATEAGCACFPEASGDAAQCSPTVVTGDVDCCRNRDDAEPGCRCERNACWEDRLVGTCRCGRAWAMPDEPEVVEVDRCRANPGAYCCQYPTNGLCSCGFSTLPCDADQDQVQSCEVADLRCPDTLRAVPSCR